MKTTIISLSDYGRSYEKIDDLHIMCTETGRIYEKQLEHACYVWFADVKECDENTSTVMCWLHGSGSMRVSCDNAHATNSLLFQLDSVANRGMKPDYISRDALQYVEEMRG